MDWVIYTALLLFTFYGLARIVDLYFVESLEFISKKLRLSSDVAGATFMAIGSSAPELFVSFLALFRVSNEQSIGAGTIVGSAIFNILVIVGASALVRRAKLTWQPVIRDLVFYSVAIIILLFTFQDGVIDLKDSLVFVMYYVLYLLSFKYWKKLFPYQIDEDMVDEMIEDEEKKQSEAKHRKLTLFTVFDRLLSYVFLDLKNKPSLYWVNFLISILLIGALSHLMVESAVHLAHLMNISEVVIGLTILAAGTSVPDLLSSINVAKKGRGDMAIANGVGSNIFDIAIGLGVPWLIVTGLRGDTIQVATENLNSSIILLFATVVALIYILLMKRWEMGRYAGILLIAGYIFYILTQIGFIYMDVCINFNGTRCFALG
ncbi:calcium/sodium antiporter [Candidatus Nomurabacteria bacterium]|uniref:Calcium/sodium antiporter n=1 Tax=Candidatus Dojkabacteria bacterium TaxID=2099670 RepID=A0A955I288_9BACT|nr:calcium/sodium antiporter [Candidatus Dojkabacteria bacterium]MCB9790055.1 calcium/sodium antiporter [Candidatus Nomurabacteria bacterium]